jgi:hypothetical protein
LYPQQKYQAAHIKETEIHIINKDGYSKPYNLVERTKNEVIQNIPDHLKMILKRF